MKLVFTLLFSLFSFTSQEIFAATDSQWKVEVIITSPSFSGLATVFGHSALLLIPPGKKIQQGTVWDFQANVQTANQENSFSVGAGLLTGKYPFIVSDEPALLFFSRHIVYELRNIQRIVVPTTPAQSEKLIQILNQLKENPENLKRYKFRNENCLTALLRTLKSAGLSINLKQLIFASENFSIGMIPAQAPLVLKQLLISHHAPINSLNVVAQIKRVEKKYDLNLKSVVKDDEYVDWSDAERKKLNLLQGNELILASQALSVYDDKRLPFVRNLISQGKFSRRPVVEMKELPSSFYKVCSDEPCAQAVADDIFSFYNRDEIRRMRSYMYSEYLRSQQLFIPEFNVLETPQAQSWLLIYRELHKKREP